MPKQPKPKPVGRPKLAKGDAKAEMLRVRATPEAKGVRPGGEGQGADTFTLDSGNSKGGHYCLSNSN
jgi:hypothetical protein